ncbi:SMI1/KNR4 family protein [Ornithinibacillus xuwenensis]|uniref:SMI1/KNR4 family protein n=1 Tax=Ornithinibacillus xuwenensis TaxID=3144668 RepID=A0ABU9XF09_9BACI
MDPFNEIKSHLIDGKLIIKREDGYVEEESFTFYAPASETESKLLPSFAPIELLSFLKLHNGADLYVSPKYSGGTHLFSVKEILHYSKEWECPDNFLPIGIGLDGLRIVCQCYLEKVENFIWVGEFIDFEDDYHNLNMNYKTWLERYVAAQGDPFWEK